MKIVMVVLVIAAIIIGFLEQGKEHPNLYVMCGCIVVFMFAAMKIGSKIPGKKSDESNEDVQ